MRMSPTVKKSDTCQLSVYVSVAPGKLVLLELATLFWMAMDLSASVSVAVLLATRAAPCVHNPLELAALTLWLNAPVTGSSTLTALALVRDT